MLLPLLPDRAAAAPPLPGRVRATAVTLVTADGGEGRSALVRLDCLLDPALGCHLPDLHHTLGSASACNKGTCHFQASLPGGWVSRQPLGEAISLRPPTWKAPRKPKLGPKGSRA
ncbi:hypothetical protein E2320_018728, partial [Naja naja]